MALLGFCEKWEKSLTKGLRFYDEENFSEVLHWFQEAGNQGDAVGQCRLGDVIK
jgi:TPR repeat protein